MPDEPSWPTVDDDTPSQDVPEPPTVQVKRPPVESPTMRFPAGGVRKSQGGSGGGESVPPSGSRVDAGPGNLRTGAGPLLKPPPGVQPASPLFGGGRPSEHGPRRGGPKPEHGGSRPEQGGARQGEQAGQRAGEHGGQRQSDQGGQRSEHGGHRSEQGGQRLESSGQRQSEQGGQRLEHGGQRPGNGGPRPFDQGGQRPENGGPRPFDQRPENGGQRPFDRGRQPEHGQQSPEQGGQRPEFGGPRQLDQSGQPRLDGGPTRPMAQPPAAKLQQASPPGGPPGFILPAGTDSSGPSSQQQPKIGPHNSGAPDNSRTQPVGGNARKSPEADPEDTHAEPERIGTAEKRKRPWLVIGSQLAVAILGVGSILTYNAFSGPAAVTTQPPAPPAEVRPMVKTVDGKAPAPSASGIGKAFTGPAASGLLQPLTGAVIDPANNTVLWQQGAATPGTPASSLKILTAAAALLQLERTDQLTTKVVAGPEPGSVVLVGGGDVTLSSKPAGTTTVYPGAATLDDLAAKVTAKGPVTKVYVDLSRYAGDAMAPGWDPLDIAGGSIAPMVPIMMDGGRADPAKVVSPRSATPGQAVADAFAQRVGGAGATVGTAPAGAQVIAEVKSAPVEQLVDNLMQISDNLLAEAMSREVARATGNEQSFAGGMKAVKDVLAKNGFDVTGVDVYDASGLSARNKVPAKLLADILAAAAKPGLDDQRTAKLRPLLTALPVAGGSGTLAERYQNVAASGKGWVRAKTGTLTGVNSLAGVVVDKDGRLLVFAFMTASTGNTDDVRQALDVLAATLRGCGCS
ncbi:D-alanyl-D-alanine carboxypeptidase/D-alanyl-D-alanine-endopeptidase [Lentzea tibetensis]|uniref:D-alanyl-D-alanine carboxypeptidase/D-alanyl-D-alanine-endopeptidase n=1 Tax=Lentzea tibetensis TaxID=2591470 RepID=A0A563EV13_9PSEU|nr:D-alanyl-D-alanine carboxypeptidase/D-alanyl-D-alanine-endopeptidase [Lentzea tibetensis]TWP51388.1 D-alanyl-D-alanine carboxypeptidase/D-alanyl-D-alanine-endopeptidase [Lentzea tibetensis]